MMREDIFTYLMGELSEVIEPIAWGYYHAESVSSRAAQASPQLFSPLALLKSELEAMAAKLMLQDSVISSKQFDLLAVIELLPGDPLKRENLDRKSPSNAPMQWRRTWEDEGSFNLPDRFDSVNFAKLYDRHHQTDTAELVRLTFLRFALICTAIEPVPSRLRATFLSNWWSKVQETGSPATDSPDCLALHEAQASAPILVAFSDIAAVRVERDLETLVSQLDAMVGIDLVKAKIKLWMTRALQSESPARLEAFGVFPGRLVLVGNEGAGKTSVARLIASLYRSLGILPKADIVEIDASSLVSEEGLRGEEKLNTAVHSAVGGVLVVKNSSCLAIRRNGYPIDLAQALIHSLHGIAGKLAIILDCRPGVAMEAVVSNRSLAAEFENFLHFPDFSAKELADIFCQLARQLRFTLDDSAVSKIEMLFERILSAGSANFQNSHIADSYLKICIAKKAARLANRGNIKISELSTFNSTDIDQLIECTAQAPMSEAFASG